MAMPFRDIVMHAWSELQWNMRIRQQWTCLHLFPGVLPPARSRSPFCLCPVLFRFASLRFLRLRCDKVGRGLRCCILRDSTCMYLTLAGSKSSTTRCFVVVIVTSMRVTVTKCPMGLFTPEVAITATENSHSPSPLLPCPPNPLYATSRLCLSQLVMWALLSHP